jgi:hypothetical protein
MFGITYIINGHEVGPRTRLAAKELPQTIELYDAPALQPSLEDGQHQLSGRNLQPA